MKKQYKGYPDAMAEEDFELLVAIAEHLAQEIGLFRINLPNGVYIANGPDPASERFTFAGIDAIREAHQKFMEVDTTTQHYLVMPTSYYEVRTQVGYMFGMPVYVDPDCPKDRFIIKAEGQAEKS